MNAQDYSSKEIDSLIQSGSRNFKVQGRYDKVIKWNIRFIEISKKQNYTEGEILGYINVGNALWIIGKYEESIEFLNIAETKSKKINNPFLRGKIYQEYAQTYNSMGLYHQALKNNTIALKYIKNIRDATRKRKVLSYMYGSRSVFLRNLNLPDSSLVYLYKSVKIRPKPVNLSNLADHYLYYAEERDLDSTAYYLKRAFSIVENDNATIYEKAVVNQVFGSYCSEIKDYETAIVHYNKALEFAKAINVPYVYINTYESLIGIYGILQNKKMELLYRQKHKVFNDSIHKLKNNAINASLNILLEQKEREHVSSHKRLYNILGLITFSLILILTVLFFRNRRKNELIVNRERENVLLKKKMNQAFDEVVKLAKNNDPAFTRKFQEVYLEFSEKLLKIKPALTPSEFTLCAYIWLNFSSKEIARYTFVTHKTVQVKKYRLRKKLSIPTHVDLYCFFKTLNDGN
ncbi:LuxR C-terminal-related transcriptional regulator [Sinomicrobium kalidii]|uniref:tetratricopeptide repeat protein n=1 Tax=Sinomicrobium kalidii TaxID=2900738 RepID=UPI001E5D5594|nr:LuxR C-terminal-related transcriptional regulator [Sinomicrobium kalidii]UGU17666.1 LuxR C-terminal-related transcriptional regulator [Sinomicrobium kalidii]